MHTLKDFHKAFVCLMEHIDDKHKSEIFREFCEMAHYALYQAAQKVITNKLDQDIEDRFEKLRKRYPDHQYTYIQQMLGLTVEALETLRKTAGYVDFLGYVYTVEKITNDSSAQHFTPPAISQLMAKMQLGDVEQQYKDRLFITVRDPCCGSGGMPMAFATELEQAGKNPQTDSHYTCQDVDFTCVCMTYIQMTLYGLPAVILHGSTLRNKVRGAWPTIRHIMDCWDMKLKNQQIRDEGKLPPIKLTAAELAEAENVEPAEELAVAESAPEFQLEPSPGTLTPSQQRKQERQKKFKRRPYKQQLLT